jgi:outer membrane protein TolC
LEVGERIKANEAQKRAAKEHLDLADGRYRVGVGSIIEITEAQVINTRAQTDHIGSVYDHKVAEARLFRAMGRGSEFSP